jgi:acyl-CoA thioester hydrolase
LARAIEPHRLLLQTYPFPLSFDTQFTDMDVAAHINNLSIARFYESARARFQLKAFERKDFFRRDAPYTMVLAEANLRYLAECNFPDPVEVGTGISRIGNSSYVFHQALFQHGICASLCEAAMVLTIHGKPSPIPADVRERMNSMLITLPS